jgi:glycine C-acetyltransferase
MKNTKDNIYQSTIKSMQEKGLYNNIRTIESGQGAYLIINGKKLLNLCSNNYLGLASDKRLRKAAITAISKYGVGTGSVRSLSGTNILHLELEKRLAKFKHADGAIALTSGYMANLAAVQTFIGKEDIVISDELNHASIIDAVRLSGVKNKFIYKHNDIVDLERILEKEVKPLASKNKTDGPKPVVMIITDGVFSMDGDLAPLPGIVKLAKKYGALTMVDDAHGEGVIGKHGRGIVDHFHLNGEVDLEVGTLSKAFGVVGGFITGKTEMIEYLRQKARQFLFSNGLSIPDTRALIESVKILEKNDSQVKKLWKNATYLKSKLLALGFDCGHSETPITPLMIGSETVARDFSLELFKRGVYATPIKFPMVALGKARLRLMPSATHTTKDLNFALSAIKDVAKKLKVLK